MHDELASSEVAEMRGARLLLWGRHMDDMLVPQLVQGPPSFGLRFSFRRLGRAPLWTGSVALPRGAGTKQAA